VKKSKLSSATWREARHGLPNGQTDARARGRTDRWTDGCEGRRTDRLMDASTGERGRRRPCWEDRPDRQTLCGYRHGLTSPIVLPLGSAGLIGTAQVGLVISLTTMERKQYAKGDIQNSQMYHLRYSRPQALTSCCVGDPTLHSPAPPHSSPFGCKRAAPWFSCRHASGQGCPAERVLDRQHPSPRRSCTALLK
jgi:hypothetical protein